MDECSDKVACTCPGCSCRNTWGGYHCRCGGGNQVYIQAEDTCVGKSAAAMGWLVTALVLSCLVGAGLAGFAFYKYRLRVRTRVGRGSLLRLEMNERYGKFKHQIFLG